VKYPPKGRVSQYPLDDVREENTDCRAQWSKARNQPQKPGKRDRAGNRRVQKIQMRALDHDDRFAQRNKGIRGTGQSNDAQPKAALPKCWTVNEQNRAARERQDRDEWQQNPQHPLSKSSVGSGSHVVIARSRHAGYDWRENGIESLVDLSQAVRRADDCTVDADGCKGHPWRASNEVTEHEKIQPSNERVNQLINADWSTVRDKRPCFAQRGNNFRVRRNMAKQL
jgi:hypothetical protein